MSTKLPSVTSPPWGTNAKRIVSLILLILFFLVARQVSGMAWSVLIIAMVLAYLLSPLVTFFEKRLDVIKSPGTRRTVSVLMSWLVMLAVLALIMGLIIPAMISQVRQLANDLPDLVRNFQGDLEKRLSKPIRIGDRIIIPWVEIQSAIGGGENGDGQNGATQALQDRLIGLTDSAFSAATNVLSFVLSLFIVLVMLFYLMRDGPNFVTYISNSIPESYRGDFMRLLYELGKIWNSYLRGQMLLNLAVGVATYIVALILGLPNPLILAVLAGFLELIPNLGPTLALIPAFLLALISDSATFASLNAGLGYALIVTLAYTGIQQLESIFLVPRIMGSSLDLHPFVVLVAILIGASLGGILGVILAAPATATLRLFGRYLRAKLLDEEAFPAMPTYMAQARGVTHRLLRFFLSRRFPVAPPEDVTREVAEMAPARGR